MLAIRTTVRTGCVLGLLALAWLVTTTGDELVEVALEPPPMESPVITCRSSDLHVDPQALGRHRALEAILTMHGSQPGAFWSPGIANLGSDPGATP